VLFDMNLALMSDCRCRSLRAAVMQTALCAKVAAVAAKLMPVRRLVAVYCHACLPVA